MMKRLTYMILSAALLIALAACGAPANDAEGTAAPVEDGKKVLVVYYSATNHTESVAQTIASTLGGDLFELTPVDEYTAEDLDWTNDASRVNAEHEDEAQRSIELVTATQEHWDDYDVVFIGYPIWWGIAAWPVNQFVTENDFTGKTVIPFCTSASSDLGQSGTLLAGMAGTGDWQEGQRFSSGASQSEITDWINGLGL